MRERLAVPRPVDALLQEQERGQRGTARVHGERAGGERPTAAETAIPADRFAFDPKRKARPAGRRGHLAVAERRLYRRLIAKAVERFDGHLDRLKATRRTR